MRITAVVLGVAAVAASLVAFSLRGDAALAVANVSWTLAAVVALLGTAFAARRVDEQRRRPWRYLVVAVAFWLAGQLFWDAYALDGTFPQSPNPGDLGWYAFGVIGAIGLYRFTSVPERLRRVLQLDALAIFAATAAATCALLYDQMGASQLAPAAIAVVVVYPVLYLGLAAIMLVALLGYLTLHRNLGLVLAFAGVGLEAIAFAMWGPQSLALDYVPGTHANDLLWTFGLLFIGAGGFLAPRGGALAEISEPLLKRRLGLPVVGFLALVGLLAVFAVDGQPLGARLTLLAGLLCTGVTLFIRQWILSRELLAAERQAQDELERVNAELQQFAYAASHDLQAPLVSIAGLAASLERRLGDRIDERERHYLERIEANATLLRDLISDMLTYARAGGIEATEAVDPEPIVREIVDQLRERAGAVGANVEVVAPLPKVRAHPVALRQALANLVENAVAHGGRDGAVNVSVSGVRANGHVELFVDDDGPGVDEATRDSMFDLFRKRAGGGNGVGLALVKRVAEASGGGVRYEPLASGGTRFVLALPKGGSE